MEEILALLRENNQMLKLVLAYLSKFDSPEYQAAQDFKGLVANLVSDLYTNGVQNRLK